MKVFISWSGEASRKIAAELYEWLPMVVQSISPYMSAESIEKGTRWATSIADELDGASVGVVVLTPENLNAPWIHFEAGALAKVVDQTRLAPVLFGLKPSDIGTPLSQFQVTQFNREDTLKLLKSINAAGGEEALPESRLEKMHDALWGDLQQKIDPIIKTLASNGASTTGKPEDETSAILEELLVLVRQQASISHSPERMLTPDVIAMIIDIAVDRGLPHTDQRRLQMIVRALMRSWTEFSDNLSLDRLDAGPVNRELHDNLAHTIRSILDDLMDLANHQRRRSSFAVKPSSYRDPSGRTVRRSTDGSVVSALDVPDEG